MEKEYKELSKQITTIEKSLQHLLALEMFKLDTPQAEIAKQLGIATGSVNKLLKGIKKPK